MNLTLRLPGKRYAHYLPNAISLATPLHFFLEMDTLVAGDYDSPLGWYERVDEQPGPSLHQVGLDQYAFCGQVQEVDVQRQEMDLYYFVLLDCGAPISFVAVDLAADPGSGDVGQHAPHPGRWLMGVGRLALAWDDDLTHPLAQTIQGSVIGIERLVLRPGPRFGEIRTEDSLPPLPFAPDQIFLTLKII